MEKHAQSWVYRCASPQCGLTGVVNEADLQSLQTTGPITCLYSGHKMDRIRKATDQDLRELQPLIPVVPKEGGPIVLRADPWWPMEHIRVVSNQITYGLGSMPYLTAYMRLGHPSQSSGVTGPGDGEGAPEYLTEEDVARHFSVSVRIVRRWVSAKKLKPIRLTKKKKVFTWALIDEFIKREAGILGDQGTLNSARPQPFSPTRRSMSLDESRALLRELKQKP